MRPKGEVSGPPPGRGPRLTRRARKRRNWCNRRARLWGPLAMSPGWCAGGPSGMLVSVHVRGKQRPSGSTGSQSCLVQVLLSDLVNLGRALPEAGEHLACKGFDALDGLLMGEKARTADDIEVAESAGLALEVHDLAIDR